MRTNSPGLGSDVGALAAGHGHLCSFQTSSKKQKQLNIVTAGVLKTFRCCISIWFEFMCLCVEFFFPSEPPETHQRLKRVKRNGVWMHTWTVVKRGDNANMCPLPPLCVRIWRRALTSHQMVSIQWGMHAEKCLCLTGIPWGLYHLDEECCFCHAIHEC